MPDFLSSFILSQRIKELESCSKREIDDLSALAKLVGRVEKRSQWLQKRIRTQRRKTVPPSAGSRWARSYLAAAQIREYVANWASKQRAANVAALPVAELERNVARLVGEIVAIVEQSLKTRDNGTSELPISPLLTRTRSRSRSRRSRICSTTTRSPASDRRAETALASAPAPAATSISPASLRETYVPRNRSLACKRRPSLTSRRRL